MCKEPYFFQFPDNLQSWETFEAQTVESHKQLDAADQEFASIKKIFDLTNGPADFNKRMKTAANFRNVIEGLFNAVNDCNNIIQQNLPEDKKKEMTDQVGLIRTQSSGVGRKQPFSIRIDTKSVTAKAWFNMKFWFFDFTFDY